MRTLLRLPQASHWTPEQDLWSHRLYCGLTQSGKTLSMLRSLMSRYEKETAYCQMRGIEPPYSRVTIIDPKGSLWGGYDTVADLDGRSCVVRVDESDLDTILQAYNKLAFFSGEVLPKRRRTRMNLYSHGQAYNPRPHILIIEEWLYLLDIANDYDFANGLKGNASLEQKLIRKVKSLVRTGLEDGVQIWLSTQEPTVEANRFSGSFRSNFDFYCFGSPVRGYESIEIALDARYNIVRSGEARKRLSKRLQELSDTEQWVTFAISGDTARQEKNGPRLGRTPWIDPILKRQQFIRGTLPALFSAAAVEDTAEQSQATDTPSPAVDEDTDFWSDSSGSGAAENIVAFPSPNTRRLTKGAQRLVDFTRVQGGVLPRLQQAYSRLGTNWNTADTVRTLAQECVDAGLARLVENPGYAGSYRFELCEAHVEDRLEAESSSSVEQPQNDYYSSALNAARQPGSMPVAAGEQCRSCAYFAGAASIVRCAVNPAGDANECRDWSPHQSALSV